MAIGKLDEVNRSWWFEQAGPDYARRDQIVQAVKDEDAAEHLDSCTVRIYSCVGDEPNRFLQEHVETVMTLPQTWIKDAPWIVGLRVVGNDMRPLIQDGFIVIVKVHGKKNLGTLDGQIVAAKSEQGICVRWLRRSGDAWLLMSQSAECAPIDVKTSGYEVLGRVVLWIGRPTLPGK
jgi:hypothetical protein